LHEAKFLKCFTSTNILFPWVHGWLVGWLVGQSVGQSVGCFACWFIAAEILLDLKMMILD